MKYLYSIAFITFTISCLDSKDVLTEEEFKALPDVSTSSLISTDACVPKEEIWICYNPSSQFHNQECHEECYTPSDNSKFCWHLDVQSCKDKIMIYEWQIEHCPKLVSCD